MFRFSFAMAFQAALTYRVYVMATQRGRPPNEGIQDHHLDGLVFGALVALAWGSSAQTVLLAAIAFLLYLLVRPNPSKPTDHPPVAASGGNEFVVERDELSLSEIELDVDINYRPRKNHFRFDSRFDTASSDAEFEYKLEGTKVFVRLLHESSEDIGVKKHWDIRDGVVQEADIRERSKTEIGFIKHSADGKIAALKKAVEWQEIPSSYGNGLKYFILYKNLPTDDARRFCRQEIERLKRGGDRFIEEATKIGFILDETSKWRLRLPDGVDPPEDERRKLFESISSFGISYDEFTMAPGLIAALDKYLGPT